MRARTIGTAAALGLFLLAGTAVPARAQEKSILIPVSLQVDEVEPFLTVGDSVKGYKMAGKPGGMGMIPTANKHFDLFVNHDFDQDQGARHDQGGKGAFVSVWDVRPYWDSSGLLLVVEHGRDGVRKVYVTENGRHERVRNGRFGRLSGGFMAGQAEGFDRPIFLTGEDAVGKDTLQGLPGGASWALVGRDAYELPRLGRFAKAGVTVLAGTGHKTVVLMGDDGEEGPGCHLYVYIGRKKATSRDAVEKNGLTDGDLYALSVPGHPTESGLGEVERALPFKLVKVDWRAEGRALETAAKTAGATGFARVEASAQNPSSPGTVYFATRGSDARDAGGHYVNHNGRLYRLDFSDLSNPAAGGTLKTVLHGGEGVISPVAIALDKQGRMVICEAPNFPLSGRDTSVWEYKIKSGELDRLMEVRPSAAGRKAVRGDWDTSGVLNASGLLGEGWWIVSVQAHYPVHNPELVEGGQLVAFHTR
jgi:hypothetical protein